VVPSQLNTLPKLLRQKYLQYGSKKRAMRVKERGIWQHYTWKDYYEKVKWLSLGLISLGLQPDDKVAILGENKPQWYWAELAVQSARGVVIGIFTDCLPVEVKYYLDNSESKFVIVHDQEQVDKLLIPYRDKEGKDHQPIVEENPGLKKIIYWDTKGMRGYEGAPIGDYSHPKLMGFNELIQAGIEYEKSNPALFEQNMDSGQGDDIGIFLYTSGTTGLPKGAMIRQRALVDGTRSWLAVDRWQDHEQYLSFLPPAWVTEQSLGVGGNLLSGMEINFPEEPETVQENIREIGPNILFWGPRNWESVTRLIQAKMIDTSTLRRFMYRTFLPVGQKAADLKLETGSHGWFWQALYSMAHFFVFRALKDKVGLLKVRCAYSAGAAVSPDIFRYFQSIGVNIKQLYGSTEMGLVTIHADADVRPETCGPPMPGYEIRLSEEGEVMVRSDKLFAGYYKKPEATQKTYRGEWYKSGDFGHIEENGHLVIIDRMDDLKELSGQRKFSPQYAEIRLRFSPYIKDVLVVGGPERDFVTSIVNIDTENVGRWAEARKIAYTTFTDLSQKPEVIGMMKNEIARVNKNLPEWSRIKRFVNLHKEFDADEDELTRTRKIRRDFIENRYSYLITALYGDSEELQVDASIVYRDGRAGTIKTSIKINAL